ncbi:MAG: ybhF [Bacteroidetes bacterium]|jgi:ABC-2 type transport system ATP-binding protein|nr:ybhF [Bacteroidota bacterium]
MLQQKLIHEVETSLQHSDYSLLTRRLMDFCEEFNVSDSNRREIINLRRTYLNSENKEGGVIGEEALAMAQQLITEFKSKELSYKKYNAVSEELLVSANGLSKQFSRGRTPFKLHPLDVKLRLGEITGVVGENGNGKTTLLRILAGELSSDTGTLLYPALHVNNWYGAKSHLAFIPQRIDRWFGTLLDNLRFYATIHNLTGPENDNHIDYILYRLGLDKFRDLKWTEISSGYRLRFELAKMLLWKPKLLILDEPLANLDINAQQLFLQDLKFFTQSVSHPVSIILSSQNLHEIERVADNIIFIRQGKTVYNGSQKDFAFDRQQNSFELSGKFDLDTLVKCFVDFPEFKVENAGTSFIVTTSINCNIYTVTNILRERELDLNYIRDISQSTRKLFHKDI